MGVLYYSFVRKRDGRLIRDGRIYLKDKVLARSLLILAIV